jgi:hypothetical protein
MTRVLDGFDLATPGDLYANLELTARASPVADKQQIPLLRCAKGRNDKGSVSLSNVILIPCGTPRALLLNDTNEVWPIACR